MKVGDLIKVKTHFGNKLCVIDKIDGLKVHFANKNFGLEVDKSSIRNLSILWRSAKVVYNSFN
jgi:hypothetical protein